MSEATPTKPPVTLATIFGNELPCGLTWRLYKACNTTVTQDAIEKVCELYWV
jgi:hypothetical protein